MNDDVMLKLIFTSGMVILYVVIFLTQKLDVATASALASAFTNALVGFFAYNYVKRVQREKYEKS